MPGMVKMKVLSAMPEPVRRRLSYRTRMLMADDEEFEVGPSEAQTLSARKWAEEAKAMEAPEPPRRRRSAKAAAAEQVDDSEVG